jgi:hypothetical protein
VKNDKDFKCDKCKDNEINELWMFGNFGNNEHKKKDDKKYCIKCFLEVEEAYDKRRSS